MSDRATRLTGLYAAIAATAAVVLSPLLALSYFATDDGAEALTTGTVSAWAHPARDLAASLLTWASPDRVYATYTQAFLLLFPAVILCALAVRARRTPARRTERWGWRIALLGYGLATLGLATASLALAGGNTNVAALNVAFLALMIPGMLFSAAGSSTLGIALLRDHSQSPVPASLLALAFPSMLVLSAVLGHNSIGMLPLMLAWGITGLRLRRDPQSAVPRAVSVAAAQR